MYAGVVSYTFRTDRMEEARTVWQNAVPVIEEQKGFRGAFLLTDSQTGKSLSIGLWETREDAAAFQTTGAFQNLAAGFAGLLTESPSREQYEVLARTP